MSCVTGFTGITGTSFFTQDIRSDLPKEFVHAGEEADTESKKNNPLRPWNTPKTT